MAPPGWHTHLAILSARLEGEAPPAFWPVFTAVEADYATRLEATTPSENSITAQARIIIHRPAAEVFNAFERPELMSRFWFARRDDGLRAGEILRWRLGPGDDALAFDVRVVRVERPTEIIIGWGDDAEATTVAWSFEPRGPRSTLLRVVESGFQGAQPDVVARELESTGGFNQVAVAAKAMLEHGVDMNIVTDHP